MCCDTNHPWRPLPVLVVSLLVLLAACAPTSDTSTPAEDEATPSVASPLSSTEPPVPSSAAPFDSSDTRSVARRVDDAALAAQVQQALLDTAALRPFSFDVTVRNRQVALRGSVYAHAQRQLAGTVAGRVEGIEQLFNEIIVLDSSRVPPDTSSPALRE